MPGLIAVVGSLLAVYLHRNALADPAVLTGFVGALWGYACGVFSVWNRNPL